MKLTLITLDVSYEPYYIIYVDGKRFAHGDDYHEKLADKFEGIKNFLEFAKIPFEAEELDFNTKNDFTYYDYDYQPKDNETLEKYLKRVNKFSEPA